MYLPRGRKDNRYIRPESACGSLDLIGRRLATDSSIGHDTLFIGSYIHQAYLAMLRPC